MELYLLIIRKIRKMDFIAKDETLIHEHDPDSKHESQEKYELGYRTICKNMLGSVFGLTTIN